MHSFLMHQVRPEVENLLSLRDAIERPVVREANGRCIVSNAIVDDELCLAFALREPSVAQFDQFPQRFAFASLRHVNRSSVGEHVHAIIATENASFSAGNLQHMKRKKKIGLSGAIAAVRSCCDSLWPFSKTTAPRTAPRAAILAANDRSIHSKSMIQRPRIMPLNKFTVRLGSSVTTCVVCPVTWLSMVNLPSLPTACGRIRAERSVELVNWAE